MPLPPWTYALALLVASGYAVPYLLLADTESWRGAFLFWLGFGAATWLLLIGVVARWNTAASRPPSRENRR